MQADPLASTIQIAKQALMMGEWNSVGPDAMNRSVALTLCFPSRIVARHQQRNGDGVTRSVNRARSLTNMFRWGLLLVHRGLCRQAVVEQYRSLYSKKILENQKSSFRETGRQNRTLVIESVKILDIR
jgi:hypothetical protein